MEIREFLKDQHPDHIIGDDPADYAYRFSKTVEGYEKVGPHSLWGGGEGERFTGTVYKRLSDGTHWWVNYWYESWDIDLDWYMVEIDKVEERLVTDWVIVTE